MSEKPILFNDEMVRAILDGRKTQTRRIAKTALPPYSIGDILYVRETWLQLPSGEYEYRTDYRKRGFWYLARKWHPSIHMPKAAARIFLRVLDIGKQPVWHITELDAKAEGVVKSTDYYGATYMDAFEKMWIGLYGDRSWKNDWVWVIKFERVEKQNV